MLIKPNFRFRSVNDITPELLEQMGVKALLLDVDNTLAVFRTKVPYENVPEWLSLMRENGICMHILSNGKPGRLTEFAKNTDLECFYMSMKPLPFKINKAIKGTARI